MDGPFAVTPDAPGMELGVPTLEQIKALESAMLAMPQLPITTEHFFGEGIYARQISAPKGALLVGKMHRTAHINVLSKGTIIVWTEDGAQKLIAPCTFVAKPGTKRVGFVLEDTVWTTFHPNPTDEKNLDLLEDRLICRETLNPPPRNPELESQE